MAQVVILILGLSFSPFFSAAFAVERCAKEVQAQQSDAGMPSDEIPQSDVQRFGGDSNTTSSRRLTVENRGFTGNANWDTGGSYGDFGGGSTNEGP